MQCGKYMVSTGCQGSAVVAMQGEGCLGPRTGHSVWAVACACSSGTPPPSRTGTVPEPPRNALRAQELPPSCTGTLPGTPHQPPCRTATPPPSCTGTSLHAPLPRTFMDPFCTRAPPPPSCVGTPFLDHFLSPFVTGILRTSLYADVDVYPRLGLESVDEEERAAPLPVAPSEAPRTVDGRAPSLQDPLTWLWQSTLTITDMHTLVTRQVGTIWYRDCTPTVRKGKATAALQLRLLVACTDSLAEPPQRHG